MVAASENNNSDSGSFRLKPVSGKILRPVSGVKSSGPVGPVTEKNMEPQNPQPEESVSEQFSPEFFNTTTTYLNEVVDDLKRLKILCTGCNQKLDVTTLKPFSQFQCPVCGVELTVPQRFDNYLLESAVGQGGMSTVYRGRDMTLDREVAIKVLSPAVARDRERCELFLNEARTAATINHFAVIPIYTCGVFEGKPFIVMQYMKSGSLEAKISAANPPPVIDAVQWMKSVVEGLECAHRHGIIHHDIKPGNIMLDNTGCAKIGDFGIAQAINDTRATKIFEISKSWVSPHYVSPEKAVSGKEDYRGDIYSLAATFYHILTGHTPFKHDDVEELIKIRLVDAPGTPSRYNHRIPKRLSRLLLDMMQVNPLNRPEYDEIITELDFILNKLTQESGKAAEGSVSRKLKIRVLIVLAGLICWTGIVFLVYHKISNAGMDEIAELHTVTPPPDEMVMAVGRSLSAGDTQKAAEMAKNILEDGSAAPKDRKCAAIQLAISNFLNNNRYAPENCNYIITKMSEAGISSTAPAVAIVRFLERQEITPADLRDKLNEASASDIFAGNLAIMVRSMYWVQRGEGNVKDLQAAFQILSDNAEKLSDSEWISFWKKRVELFAAVMEHKKVEEKKLEPLLEQYLAALAR